MSAKSERKKRIKEQKQAEAAGAIANNCAWSCPECTVELNKQLEAHRSDGMVRIIMNHGDGDRRESMWATPLKNGYRLENIPFFTPGLALFDVVKGEKDEDGVLFAGEVVERSGNMTVLFATDPYNQQVEKAVLLALKARDCGAEGTGQKGFWSINISPETNEVLSFLAFVNHKVPGALVYCLSHELDFDAWWAEIEKVENIHHAFQNVFDQAMKVAAQSQSVTDIDVKEALVRQQTLSVATRQFEQMEGSEQQIQ